MRSMLVLSQILLAILLILTILIQAKGVGLSATFGGTSNVYTSKRGIEKFLFMATIVITVLFVLNTLAFIFVKT